MANEQKPPLWGAYRLTSPRKLLVLGILKPWQLDMRFKAPGMYLDGWLLWAERECLQLQGVPVIEIAQECEWVDLLCRRVSRKGLEAACACGAGVFSAADGLPVFLFDDFDAPTQYQPAQAHLNGYSPDGDEHEEHF